MSFLVGEFFGEVEDMLEGVVAYVRLVLRDKHLPAGALVHIVDIAAAGSDNGDAEAAVDRIPPA